MGGGVGSKRLVQQLCTQTYLVPDGKSVRIADKTIEHWFYLWKHGDIEALAPKSRSDHGRTKLPCEVQEAIVQAKRDNPKRSLNTLIRLLEMQGVVAKGELSRASVHRLLQQRGLTKPWDGGSEPIGRRCFVAEFSGDLWHDKPDHVRFVNNESTYGNAKSYTIRSANAAASQAGFRKPNDSQLSDIVSVLKRGERVRIALAEMAKGVGELWANR